MKTTTKDIILSVLITIVAVTVALIWIGTVENKKEAEITTQNEVKEQSKESYMSACVSDGLYEFCSCTFDEMYNKVGLEGMQRIDKEIGNNNGELTKEAEDITKVCLAKLK